MFQKITVSQDGQILFSTDVLDKDHADRLVKLFAEKFDGCYVDCIDHFDSFKIPVGTFPPSGIPEYMARVAVAFKEARDNG